MVGYEMDKPVGTRHRPLAFNHDLPCSVLPSFSMYIRRAWQEEEAEEITFHFSFLILPFAQADIGLQATRGRPWTQLTAKRRGTGQQQELHDGVPKGHFPVSPLTLRLLVSESPGQSQAKCSL